MRKNPWNESIPDENITTPATWWLINILARKWPWVNYPIHREIHTLFSGLPTNGHPMFTGPFDQLICLLGCLVGFGPSQMASSLEQKQPSTKTGEKTTKRTFGTPFPSTRPPEGPLDGFFFKRSELTPPDQSPWLRSALQPPRPAEGRCAFLRRRALDWLGENSPES